MSSKSRSMRRAAAKDRGVLEPGYHRGVRRNPLTTRRYHPTIGETTASKPIASSYR